jgi:hypothetical protein
VKDALEMATNLSLAAGKGTGHNYQSFYPMNKQTDGLINAYQIIVNENYR